MKHNIIIKTIAISFLFLLLPACFSSSKAVGTDDASGNLIIYYDPAAGKETLLEAVEEYGSEVLYEYKNFNCIAVTVPPKRTTTSAIRFYMKVKGVLSVMEDKKLELH